MAKNNGNKGQEFTKAELRKLNLWDEEFERLEKGLLKIAYR